MGSWVKAYINIQEDLKVKVLLEKIDKEQKKLVGTKLSKGDIHRSYYHKFSTVTVYGIRKVKGYWQ